LAKNKKRARIEIQPRFKIQYPMKNLRQMYSGFKNETIPNKGYIIKSPGIFSGALKSS
jgi:hypothetical protein